MPATIEERVRKVIADTLGIKEEKITPDSSLMDDLGADSLDTVQVVMALEEEFDISIPDEDVRGATDVGEAITGGSSTVKGRLSTVRGIIGYIEEKTK